MWFGSSKRPSARESQIEELRKSFPAARASVYNEDSLFDIVNRTHGGVNYTIRIVLSKSFPAEQPLVLLYTPADIEFRHPNVGAGKAMRLDGLTRWTPQSSVVNIVNEAIIAANKLDAYRVTAGGAPPIYSAYSSLQGSQSSAATAQPAAAPHTTAQYATAQHARIPVAPQRYDSYTKSFIDSVAPTTQPPPPKYEAVVEQRTIPAASGEKRQKSEEYNSIVLEVPSKFPELERLSEAQLERLLSDDVALKSHMGTVGAVGALGELRDTVRASNLDHAIDALKMESEIQSLVNECHALKNELKTAVTEFTSTRDKIVRKYRIHGAEISKKISDKCAALDSRSEQLGHDFVEGRLDLQPFLQNYLELRTKYHVLQIKQKYVKT